MTGIIAALLFSVGSGSSGETSPGVGLKDSVESARVTALQKELPGAGNTSAILVYSNDDENKLTSEQKDFVMQASPTFYEVSTDGFVPPATFSEDGKVAIIVVPLAVQENVEKQAERAAEIRESAAADMPEGLTVKLSGPEGFAVDIAAVFDGANFTLLLTTVMVVGILLIVTYRSPWLWLVPLVVIGLADGLAGIVATRVAALIGIELDASTTGILSVLVFGAGTNYALLLISRYRDELLHFEDRRDAMTRALRGAGPAVIASGGTVVLSLLTLLLAELNGNRALGIACATGVVVAMLFALLVLPAALLLFGRGLFWPYIPKFGAKSRQERGVWFKLGTAVSKKPLLVAILGLAILGGLSLGTANIQVGLSQTEQFRATPEAVLGQEIIADAFPGGSGSPAVIIANADQADAVAQVAKKVDGVASATVGESNGTITEISAVLEAEAETAKALNTITDLRDAVHDVSGADALVGGLDAQALDTQTAQERDQALIIPFILAIVFLVLLVLLRSLVAPVLLLLTVVGSFFASLGASWLLFQTVLDFPGVDTNVILFSFLFLVALGVDYNIFLVTRAKEEADAHGTRAGMIRALAATGGVITSAGILLAAVFAVLGVLPLITLTQIGVIVCIGVLLDTLLVRTVIVPALTFLCGDSFWWPRKLKGSVETDNTSDEAKSRVATA
ncbi:MMPL family transporter [Leucobacter coleopterorum]|uniref:MMPL family transporter n=2 Tax=Leucobacter coleopterorum TaxID=2714933 RepID=A0ABX6K408_9MICO|nr:MMPL family transporter [Leucobacter coleopterorum]